MSAKRRILKASLLATAMMLVFNQHSAAESIAPGAVKYSENQISTSLTGEPGDPGDGKKTFMSRKLGNCLACHTNKDLNDQPFHGEIGPSLNGVADRYSEGELRGIVVNAKHVFGGQTIMPAFYRVINDQRTRKEFHDKSILTAEQVEDVIAYLKTLKE